MRELCKPAVENAREEDRSPELWLTFEVLARRIVEASRQDGICLSEGFTKRQLRAFVEEEAIAGLEGSR